MDIEPGPEGTFYLLKDGKRFGEAVFWMGYDKPTISFSTPPGLTQEEEERVRNLPSPWATET
jgi:hypothetical protein